MRESVLLLPLKILMSNGVFIMLWFDFCFLMIYHCVCVCDHHHPRPSSFISASDLFAKSHDSSSFSFSLKKFLYICVCASQFKFLLLLLEVGGGHFLHTWIRFLRASYLCLTSSISFSILASRSFNMAFSSSTEYWEYYTCTKIFICTKEKREQKGWMSILNMLSRLFLCFCVFVINKKQNTKQHIASF